ncbi:MAG TPA: threonyl-tRNA synthetase editing domain-containing protein [Candidatus Paceibacterota bacterium]|nr:threonyl-tRNA synthetase editing domain-containing protein [Candidatus Paceibacterota bacterium]
MRALLCHCRNYRSEVKRLSNTPAGIQPEKVKEKILEAQDAVVVLLTVEAGDRIEEFIPRLAEDIQIMAKDTAHNTLVLFPFGHLSNKLADSDTTLKALDLLEESLKDFNPKRAHFGSDKKLLLDIFGHKGNVRYREYN